MQSEVCEACIFSPKDTSSSSFLVGCHERYRPIEPKGRILQVLKHIQVEHSVRLRLQALTCKIRVSYSQSFIDRGVSNSELIPFN